MNYPSIIIKKGEPDAAIVKLIQKRINELKLGRLVEDGIFGTRTFNKVRQYQCRPFFQRRKRFGTQKKD